MRGGNISVVDFGSVRDRIHTTVGGGSSMVGTFGYMAPEQLSGQAEPTTDLYGLAATLVFLITGHSPSDLPTKRLKVEFRGHANVSAPFAAWLDRMLEPAPEDRFPSARFALDALRNRTALAAAPPAAVPAAPAPPSRRSAAPFALGALVLVSGLGVAAWVTLSVGASDVPQRGPVSVNTPVRARLEPAAPPIAPVEPKPPEVPQEARWWPKPTHPPLDGPLDLLWATEIGPATYHSTIHVWKDRTVVNSNGATRADLDQKTGRKRWRHTEPRKNISSGTIIADVDPKKKGNEALFGTESGFLVALDTKGREVLRQGVGGSVECTPTAADLNADGTTDVLVASGDGKLYAFSTEGVAPVAGSVGAYVRVDASNSGIWP